MKNKTNDTRYPYTYACDLIRMLVGYNNKGTKLSRSDASSIRSFFSDILELNDYEVASKLANYYLENEEKITEKATKEALSSLFLFNSKEE